LVDYTITGIDYSLGYCTMNVAGARAPVLVKSIVNVQTLIENPIEFTKAL
jgi:hypothetical protein